MKYRPRSPLPLSLLLRLAPLCLIAQPLAAQDAWFYAGGKRHVLKATEDWVAVETPTPEREAAASAEAETSGALRRGGRTIAHSRHGITVFPVAPGRRTDAARALRAVAPTARRVFSNGTSDPIVETRDICIRFEPDFPRAQVDALLAAHSLRILRPLGEFAPNGFLVRLTNEQSALDLANTLHDLPGVRWCHPDFIWPKQSRYVPDDLMYSQQWHLNNGGGNGGTAGADIRAQRAWEFTRGSSDVIIAILDDGVATGHEDFAPGKFTGGWDFIGNDATPLPGAGQNHGTSCAGLAAATGNNSIGVSGVAPDCRIMPLRILGPSGGPSVEAAAILYAKNNGAHIISNSWGPADGLGISQPCPDVVNDAIVDAADNGRGGKGCIILFAAGNGNESSDLDGYTSHPKVISVAATLRNDTRSPYSDFGAGVDICAPGGSQAGDIVTVDRMGSAGYNNTSNYHTGFNGTSAATPIVAGAVGLLLTAEPNLTREQVYQRLIDSADFIDTANVTYDSNGHHNWYGYGRLNAWKMLGWNDTTNPTFTISNLVHNQIYPMLAAVAGSASDTGSGLYKLYGRVRNRDTNLWWHSASNTWTSNENSANQETSSASWAFLLPTGEGIYQFQIRAEDKAGNMSAWTVVDYSIDNTSPTVSITAPAAGQHTGSPPDFSGTASDNGSGIKEIRVALWDASNSRWRAWPANAWGSGNFDWAQHVSIATGTTSWNQTLPTLVEGSYELFVQALDNNDMASAWTSRAIQIDTANPTIGFTPADNSPIFDMTVIGGTISEPGTVTWSLVESNPGGTDRFWNGNAWITNGSDPAIWRPANTAGLAWQPAEPVPGRLSTRPGAYEVHARIVDRAAKTGTALVHLTRTATDTTPPDIAFTSPSPATVVTTSSLPPLTGTVADPESGIQSVSAYLMRLSGGDFYYWNGTVWSLAVTALPLEVSGGTWQAPKSTGLGAWNLPTGRNMANGSWQLQVTATNGELPAGTRGATLAFSVDYHPIYTWTQGSLTDDDPSNNDQLWGNPDNWSPYGVPGPDDIAQVSSGTVITPSTIQVHSLRQLGGTIQYSTDANAPTQLSSTVPSIWQDGTIEGHLRIETPTTFNITSGTGGRWLGNTASITNHGVVNQSLGFPVVGYSANRISNKPGATWRLDGAGDPFDLYYGGHLFTNEGILEKTGGGEIDWNDWELTSSGEIRATSGTLKLRTTTNLASGSLFSGPATLQLFNTTNLAGTLTQQAGTLELFGTLVCTADATISGAWEWEAGWIGGTLIVPAGSSCRITGTDNHWLGDGSILRNFGTVVWASTHGIVGYSASSIVNEAGATFECEVGGDLFGIYYGGNSFHNHGLFLKSGGAAATSINEWTFHNNAEMRTQFGPLEVNTTLHSAATATYSGSGQQTWLSSNVHQTGTTTVTCPLTLQASTLHASGPASIQGDWTWLSGTVSGQFENPAGNRITLVGTDTKWLDGGTLFTNYGIVRVEGGGIAGVGSTDWFNRPGSQFEIAMDGDIWGNYYAGNEFHNEGLILKSAGTGTSVLDDWTIFNTGTIRADTGQLDINSTVRWQTGTALTGPGVQRYQGTVFLDAPSQLDAPVRLTAGSITGQAAGSITGTLEWHAGTLAGTCRILAGGTLRLLAGAKDLAGGGVIENHGLIDWQAGGLQGNGSVLVRNFTGSTFRTSSDGLFSNYYGGNVLQVDAGALFEKTGPNVSRFDWIFRNNGSLEVIGGTLSLEEGGTSAGEFETAAGAHLHFASGEFRLTEGAAVAGAGTNHVNGGTVLAEGPAQGKFALESGALGSIGAATLVLTGQNQWTGGAVVGQTELAAGGELTVSTGNFKQLGGGAVLTNHGTMELQSGVGIQGDDSVTLENAVDGTLLFAGDLTPFSNYYGGNTFRNHGVVTKTSGAGATVLTHWFFENHGMIGSASGNLEISTEAAFKPGSHVAGTGRTRHVAGGLSVQGTVSIDSGTFEHAGGSLNGHADGTAHLLAAPAAAAEWTGGMQEGTVTYGGPAAISGPAGKGLGGGAILKNTGTMDISGGTIQGVATVRIENHAGALMRLAPGVDFTDYYSGHLLWNAGTLEITAPGAVHLHPWHFEQTATGTLRVPLDLGMATGLLQAASTTLAGSLVVAPATGFTPAAGSDFVPLTHTGHTGSFSSVLTTTGAAWTAAYEPNQVKITVPVGLNYADWAAAEGLTGPDALPSADPDHDGFDNFFEYAFHTNPHAPNPDPSSHGTVEISGQTWFVLRYRTWDDRIAAGVTYLPQASADLSDWTLPGVLDVDPYAPPVAGSTARRFRVPVTPSVVRFLRVRATAP